MPEAGISMEGGEDEGSLAISTDGLMETHHYESVASIVRRLRKKHKRISRLEAPWGAANH